MNNLIRNIRHNANLPLVVILGAFIILSLIYTWSTPPLEASDELWHFGMVNTIADNGQLPVQHPGIKTVYEQEGSQPPLYYLVAAFLVKAVDRSDFDAVRQPNPHAIVGIPGNIGNKNLVLHDTPHPISQGTVLAVYVIRLFSILCGCITIFSIHFAASLLGSGQPMLPVLAAALTAFNPMFLFITASVNNDNLVTALNSLIIWQMIVLFKRSVFSTRQSILIAVLVALASLSKLSGLVMLPFVVMGGIWVFSRTYFVMRIQEQSIRDRLDWRGFMTFVVLIGVMWGVVAGWWYIRNIILYGEIFGTHMMVVVAGPRIGDFSLQTLVDEFQGFRFAYWALFGAVNIMTYRWFYDVMDGASIVMILGLLTVMMDGLRSLLRPMQSEDRAYESIDAWAIGIWLTLIILAGSVSVAVWTSQTYASQGRLLFPFNSAISILGAVGLTYFGKRWIRPFIPSKVMQQSLVQTGYCVLPSALAAFATVVPFLSVAPQYAPPPVLEHIPDTAHSVYARFDDIALIGYEVPNQRYFPGDSVPITVYWQVIRPASQDYSLYLHATLDDGSVIGKVDSYPGAGRLRTSTWQSGAIYADTYVISLDKASSAVSRLRMQVGWWNYSDKTLVGAADQNNQPLKSVMLDIGGFAPNLTHETAENATPIEPIAFGDAIALVGYRLDGASLSLVWRSKALLSANDTVFVQALDDHNQVVGQGDAPPILPTYYWQVLEQFVTQHTISASKQTISGSYRIIVGWYNSDDGTRLSVAFPDNAFTLPVTLVVP